MNPTSTSSAKNGKGTKKATSDDTTIKSISPANKFPKSLSPKEKVLVSSPIPSNIPIKKYIGLLKLMYLLRYESTPILESAFVWIYSIENIEIAKVNIKSELGDLRGAKTPTPGINSIKLEHIT